MEPAVVPVSPPSSQRSEGRSTRAYMGVRAESNVQPAIAKQARQHAAAREGIHPLSRSYETLLKGKPSIVVSLACCSACGADRCAEWTQMYVSGVHVVH